MKILISLSTPNQRGLHNYAEYLLRLVQKTDVKSVLATPKMYNRFNKLRYFYIIVWELLNVDWLLQRPSHVIYVNGRASLWHLLSSKLFPNSTPKICTVIADLIQYDRTTLPKNIRFGLLHEIKSFANNIFFTNTCFCSDLIICISNSTLLQAKSNSRLSINNKRSIVIFPSLSFDKVDFVPSLLNFDDYRPLPSDIRALVVTGDSPSKNHLSVIFAFLDIANKHDSISFALDVVGIKSIPNQLLEKFSACKNLSINIHYKISKHKLASLYLNSDLFLSSSLQEGFGIPLYDSLYLDIPTITTPIPVYHELIDFRNNRYFSIFCDGYKPINFFDSVSHFIQFKLPIKKQTYEERVSRYLSHKENAQISDSVRLIRELNYL